MKVAEAQKKLPELVDKVYLEGVAIDLERDEKVIARLTPVALPSGITVRELNTFLRSLPSLGDDADAFSADIRANRAAFPAEADAWD